MCSRVMLSIELPTMMEVSHSHTVQYSSHYPRGTTEHLKCGWCDLGITFLILFNFKSHMGLLDNVALERLGNISGR